jgi:hypothetical protein
MDAFNNLGVVLFWLLTVGLFFTIGMSVLTIARAVSKGEQVQREVVERWLVGSLFLAVSLGITNVVKTVLRRDILPLAKGWEVGQQVLLFAIIAVSLIAALSVYSKQNDGNPEAFKNALVNYGKALLAMVVVLSFLKGYVVFMTNPSQSQGVAPTPSSGDFTDLIVYWFNQAFYNSRISTAFFIATSGLVVILAGVHIVKNYVKVGEGISLTLTDLGLPVVVIVVAVSFHFLYDGLNSGFDAVERIYQQELSKVESTNERNYKEVMGKLLVDKGLTILEFSFSSAIRYAFGYLAIFINFIIDLCFKLYIAVNDVLLGVLGPLAVVLILFEPTRGAFVEWLKQVAYFKFLYLLVLTIGLIGKLFFMYAQLSPEVNVALTLGGTESAVVFNILLLVGFIIIKVIFTLSAMTTLQKLLGASAGGVGGAVGSVANAALKVKTGGLAK